MPNASPALTTPAAEELVLLVPEEVPVEVLLLSVVPVPEEPELEDEVEPLVPSEGMPPGRLTVDFAARAWKFARERVEFAAVLGGC